MSADLINMTEAVGALQGAWLLGMGIGIIFWLIRWLLLELPRTGSILRKGGEI